MPLLLLANRIADEVGRRAAPLRRKLAKLATRAYGVFEYNVLANWRDLRPKKMMITLTYWCNSRCVMCEIWKIRPKDEMSLGEWERVLRDPIFKNLRELTVSGGEATMHPQFNELIELYVRSMPRLRTLTVITNGFVTEQILEKMERVAAHLTPRGIHLCTVVSLDGHGEVHEKVRGIEDGFRKTTDTLLGLQAMSHRYDMSVGSGSLVLGMNLDDVGRIKAWYEEHGIPYMFQLVGFFDPPLVDNTYAQGRLDFEDGQKEKLLQFLEEQSRPKSWRDIWSYYWRDMYHFYRDGKPRTTPCPYLKDQFVLDSFGDVFTCLRTDAIGSCREDGDVSGLYFSAKNRKNREKMKRSTCKGCNSGCNVEDAIAQDAKHYLWFRLSGRPLYR